MITRNRLTLLGAILGAVTCTSAQAQTWTAVPDSSRNFTAAAAEWPSGVAMIARCAPRRGLDVMLTLVRPVMQLTVPVSVTLGDAEPLEQVWRLSDEGDLLFVRLPGHFSRAMLSGLPLEILISPDEGPRQRYILNSPENPAVLTQVVTACGHPITSPIDEASVITNPDWVRRPTAGELARYYPRSAMRDNVNGHAVVQCRLAASGRVEDCITLSETPEGYGFGAASEAIATSFWLRAAQADGRPFGEVLINVPIEWRRR